MSKSALTDSQAYDLRREQAVALAGKMDVPAFLARLDTVEKAAAAYREALDAAVDLLPGALDGGGEEPAEGYHRELAEALAGAQADSATLADSTETLKQAKGMLRAVFQSREGRTLTERPAPPSTPGQRASFRV